jgi:hypothetical protein
VSH